MTYRNSIKDFNYYGSDLNKYIDDNCIREMTVINIDCLQFKTDKKIIRIIESKHENEIMPKSQSKILYVLSGLFNLLNEIQSDYKIYVYSIKGDYPYDSVKIYNFNTAENKTVNKKEFLDFLNFKLEFQ